MSIIKSLLKKHITPITFSLVALLAYGLLALQQGYYWDDWAFSWTRAHLGFQGLLDQFAVNRPIRAYWEALLTPLIGVKPTVWQFYGIFIRWAVSLSLWVLLRNLWAEKKWENALTALFFLVYPGFTQQFLAITYQYFWSLLLLFFISLTLMVQAARSPHLRTLKVCASLIISAISLFGLEYLFGLELLRFLFLWIALKTIHPNFKERAKKTALLYIPYFILLITYLYWRIFLYTNTIYTSSNISFSISGIWTQLWDAIPLVSLGAWLKVWVQPFSTESGLSPKLALLLVIILLAGTFLLARYLKYISAQQILPPRGERLQKGAGGDWLFLSLALLLSAGIPFYAVSFPIQLTFPEDRFTFPFIFGVSMLLTWLLSLVKSETQRFTLAGLLISLAITTQIYNSDIYRREWRQQRLFAQQLFWRAPDISKGTLILAEDEGVFPHNDDEAFAFLVNWAYNPNQKNTELDYEYFYVSAREGGDLPSLKSGEPVFKNHFSATFTGNTDQVLVLHFSPPSCLRILDPIYDADVFIAPRGVDDVQMGSLTLPRPLAPALPLSNPREFIAKSNDDFNPPEWLFGEEPEHNWCYYFEKADLARQNDEWERVAKLGDKAFAMPYSPADSAEYLPFIEAYARLNRDEDAEMLTEAALDNVPALSPMLCSLWQRVEEQAPSQNHARIADIYCR